MNFMQPIPHEVLEAEMKYGMYSAEASAVRKRVLIENGLWPDDQWCRSCKEHHSTKDHKTNPAQGNK